MEVSTKFFTKFYLVVLVVSVFSLIHYRLGKNNYNQPLSLIDSIYFTTTTFMAIGVGDIYPITNVAKLLACAMTSLFFMIIIF